MSLVQAKPLSHKLSLVEYKNDKIKQHFAITTNFVKCWYFAVLQRL